MHAPGGKPLRIPGRRRRRTGQTSGHPARSTQTSSPDPKGSRTSTAGLLTRGSSAEPSPSRNDPKVRSSGLSMARLSAHSCGGSRGLPAFREENRPHSLPAPRGASPLAGARATRIITAGPRRVSNGCAPSRPARRREPIYRTVASTRTLERDRLRNKERSSTSRSALSAQKAATVIVETSRIAKQDTKFFEEGRDGGAR